ncbi:type III pantothenate kinase [Wenyingzhuangia sp. IMCC45533]
MMYLVIDEGNTRIKIAVFNQRELIEIQLSDVDSFMEHYLLLCGKHKFEAAILSSVTDKTLEIYNELPIAQKFNLDSTTPLPFKNLYQTPETLGVDRLALVMAAYVKYRGKNTLIIDAGTCITYDFLNDAGEYLGGAISSGVQMRLDAMSHFTQKLPKLKLEDSGVSLIGQTTKHAMQSGVFNGTVFEMNGVIQTYEQNFDKVNTILTGGDANFLCKPLKNSIFVNPNFLLEGLNEVLIYQLKHETKFK